jgi:hypothetical protein
LLLENLGLTLHAITENPKLKDIAENYPALAREYPVQVQNGMDTKNSQEQIEIKIANTPDLCGRSLGLKPLPN